MELKKNNILFSVKAPDWVRSCKFSSDEKRVVTTSEDGSVTIFAIPTGKIIVILKAHTKAAYYAAFSRDGKKVASGSNDSNVILWDVDTKIPKFIKGHGEGVFGCTFSLDDKFLTTGSYDHTLKVWDVETQAEIATLRGHTSGIHGTALSPDGSILASAGYDKTVKLWNVPTYDLRATLTHPGLVLACAFSPDGLLLVSISNDQTVLLWDVATGAKKTTWKGHTGIVRNCVFSFDGNFVITSSDDGTVMIWDVNADAAVFTLNTKGIFAIDISSNFRVIMGFRDGTVKLVNLYAAWKKNNETIEKIIFSPLCKLAGHADDVNYCKFSPDGKAIVSASSDKTLKKWDVSTRVNTATLEGHNFSVRSCGFSSDGKLLVSGSDDELLKVWDAFTGTEKTSVAKKGHVFACAFSPDGRSVVAGTSEGVSLQELDGEGVITNYGSIGEPSPVYCCSISPDGNMMASASFGSNSLDLWDLKSALRILTLEGHEKGVISCGFSRNGKYVVSSSCDHTVKVWNCSDGSVKATMEGHSDVVTCCVIAPDSGHVISSSYDKTVKVWQVKTGQEVASLEGHTKAVLSCDISPDGMTVISGSSVSGECEDNLILWNIAPLLHKITKEFASEMPQMDPQRIRALYLKNHYFRTPPSSLLQCEKLEKLDLSGGILTDFNRANLVFPRLRHLNLQANLIKNISFNAEAYPLLSFLDITENPLLSFPDSVFQLKKLETLKVGGVSLPKEKKWNRAALHNWTKEKKISDDICEKLEKAFNKADITADGMLNEAEFDTFYNIARDVILVIPKIDDQNVQCLGITRLELLWLGLVELPSFVQQFSHLAHLNLEGNNIINVPSFVGGFQTIKEILVDDNPHIKTPPIEVVRQGCNEVTDYMRLVFKGGVKCWKTKLMLVGLGGVGKTSVLTALQNQLFVKAGPSTDGVDVHNWSTDNVEFCAWDFAGQTIYYNTHNIFLSSRAVYVVVWNVRLGIEHAGLDFWLSSIQARAPTCPILIVGTRIDEVAYHEAFIPEASLKKQYPQIRGFFGVSCSTSAGIADFRNHLVKVALNEPYMGQLVPIPYVWLERLLKKPGVPATINKETLLQLAAPTHLTLEELESALLFLNDTGVIFFSRECYVQDLIVIDPQWISKVLACVITAQVTHNMVKGVFGKKDIHAIWKAYPEELHDKLLFLTQTFELCFQLRDGNYVVPCMLPEKDPEALKVIEDIKKSKNAYRVYRTHYMPPGLFNRLQVKMQQYIEGEGSMWKSGVVLQTKDHVAFAELKGEPSIKITVFGDNPKNLLDVFHNALQELLSKSFPGISLVLGIPCTTCLVENVENISEFSINMLRKHQDKGLGYVVCSNTHFNSLATLFSLLPPDLPSEYETQQADLISDLDAIRSAGVQPHPDNQTQIFISFNVLNSSDHQKRGKVDPMEIVAYLTQKGYRIEYTKGNPQHSSESIKCCHLFIACVSNDYSLDDSTQSEFLYAVKVLRKKFIAVVVGVNNPSTIWQTSQVGLVMAGELYVDMQSTESLEDFSNRVARVFPLSSTTSPTPLQAAPRSFDCFISYCWRNSKSYNNNEASSGYADPREIAKQLQNANLSVWLDINELGEQGLFSDIAKGLRATTLVVACVSQEYAESDNCAMEIRHSSKNLRKPIIVVAVGANGHLKWCQTEVGMLAAKYTALVMGNKEEYEANLPRLIKEVNRMLQEPTESTATATAPVSVQKIIGDTQAKIEGLQRGFLSQALSADPDATFPRVFSLWNNQNTTGTQQIQFLCEHPGEWHFVEGQHITLKSPQFASSMAAYLVPLAEVLLQSSLCDPSSYLHEYTAKVKQENKKLKVVMLKAVLRDLLGMSQKDVEQITKLKKITKPTGEIQWLCASHNV